MTHLLAHTNLLHQKLLCYGCIHRVSKTFHLWLAITVTHMNGFWYFLA